MSVLGLITEYNPFHNGHLYHLEQSKRLTGCEFAVCVMSGNFVQRGEPALIDKWERAKMALKAGMDLVIELPVVYALQSAELFAFGAVKTLDSLGIIDSICFGSESADINTLNEIASILVDEPNEFKKILKKYLDTGITFPESRENALIEYCDSVQIRETLKRSNNILGIEYLKALKRIDSKIVPKTLKRIVNEYNESTLTGEISSATSIRKSLSEEFNIGSIINSVPMSTFDILSEEFTKGKGPVFSEHFGNAVIGGLRKALPKELLNILDVSEGLENRIINAALKSASLHELIGLIKTKRYTQTRIQRILFHFLLGIDKRIYSELANSGGPQYIRVLGFSENGKKLLSQAKKKSSLPIITKVADHTNTGNALFDNMLSYDITATNVYTLAYKNPQYRMGDLDFTHGIVIER